MIHVLTKRNYINVYTVERKGKDIKNLAMFVCVYDTIMCDAHMCMCVYVRVQLSVNPGNEWAIVGLLPKYTIFKHGNCRCVNKVKCIVKMLFYLLLLLL